MSLNVEPGTPILKKLNKNPILNVFFYTFVALLSILDLELMPRQCFFPPLVFLVILLALQICLAVCYLMIFFSSTSLIDYVKVLQ